MPQVKRKINYKTGARIVDKFRVVSSEGTIKINLKINQVLNFFYLNVLLL